MRICVLLGLVFPLGMTPLRAQAPEVPQSKIDAAIDRCVAHLLEMYADGEGRDPRSKPGAPTLTLTDQPGLRALTLYVLLKSGVPARNPVVEKLVARLAFERLTRNYDVACMLLALIALDPVGQRAWVDELAGFLIGHREKAGDFGYPIGGDLSNTQLAAYALHAAASVGVPVPVEMWTDLMRAVLRYQCKDGGFGYMAGTPSTNTMTAAGVGVLAICELELARAGKLDADLAQPMRRARAEGFAWLAKLPGYGSESAHSSWHHYLLYGIERAGDLCSIERIGDHDWYREGAAFLVETQDSHGDWPGTFERAPALFALLFLSRATATVRTGARFTPTTGPKPRPFQHTPGTDIAGGMRLEAEGTKPLRMWITRIVSPANAAYEWPEEHGRGPHVALVEYLIDDVPVQVALGDPEHPAGDQRFTCEHRGLTQGHHRLTAKVHLCQPEALDANGVRSGHGASDVRSSPPEDHVVTTNGIEIEIEEDVPAVALEPAYDPELDLVLRGHPKTTVSSVINKIPGWDDVFAGRLAVDGKPRTPWISSVEDDHPMLQVRLQEPQRANLVRIALAQLAPRTPDIVTWPREITVSIDGSAARTIPVRRDSGTWLELKLDRPRPVSSIEIRLVGHATQGAAVGIGEVALLLVPD